jgi:REP-associated tyrosine transposase
VADTLEAGLKPAPTRRHGLPEIVRALKTFSARRINEKRHTPGVPVWQRNYYEHIIRGDEELLRVREYILGNPLDWENDRENPSQPVDFKSVGATVTWQV